MKFFTKLFKPIYKISFNIRTKFSNLFRNKKIDNIFYKNLEDQLLISDIDIQTTKKIINSLISYAKIHQILNTEDLYKTLREKIFLILKTVDKPLVLLGNNIPFIILIVGVNGVGKTTTICKLANKYKIQGKNVMLAAGDTFRAAAIEQLQELGHKYHIPVISKHIGADSASVIFTAIQTAKTQNINVLIADTAGRFPNKIHLMDQLKKIVTVIQKFDEKAPHEIILVIDSSTGQNAIDQVHLFNDAIGLTGIIMTKLDSTANGGTIISIADRFCIPIRYISTGENIEDIHLFNSKIFIDAIIPKNI